jgi:uncharacterized protein YndB with AHSA1/START domain
LIGEIAFRLAPAPQQRYLQAMARQPVPQDRALTGFATSPSPGAIRLERLYPGPPDRLWAYLVDSVKRRDWWAAGRMDLRKDGRVDLTWYFDELSPGEDIPAPYRPHGKGHTQTGRITRIESERRLAFTWGQDSEVLFEIEPRGDDAALVVTHRRLEGRPEMIRVATGWYTHMLLLEDVLLGRERRPFWYNFALAQGEHEKLLGEPPFTIQATRRIKAAPAKVFDAWLDPSSTALWMFAYDSGPIVRAETDPRSGGKFVFTNRQSGEDVEHAGTYIEMNRPLRLVFTFCVPAFSSDMDRVTLDIAPSRDGCEVRLLHEMRPVWMEFSDRAEMGWLKILAAIAARVEA